jgi:nitrate reductase NapD
MIPTDPDTAVNLSAIFVLVSPDEVEAQIDSLNALTGVEVHHRHDATGRLIVIQEAENVAAEVEGLKRIKALPGVLLAELVSHYFGEDDQLRVAAPADLDDLDGLAQAQVPGFLND